MARTPWRDRAAPTGGHTAVAAAVVEPPDSAEPSSRWRYLRRSISRERASSTAPLSNHRFGDLVVTRGGERGSQNEPRADENRGDSGRWLGPELEVASTVGSFTRLAGSLTAARDAPAVATPKASRSPGRPRRSPRRACSVRPWPPPRANYFYGAQTHVRHLVRHTSRGWRSVVDSGTGRSVGPDPVHQPTRHGPRLNAEPRTGRQRAPQLCAGLATGGDRRSRAPAILRPPGRRAGRVAGKFLLDPSAGFRPRPCLGGAVAYGGSAPWVRGPPDGRQHGTKRKRARGGAGGCARRTGTRCPGSMARGVRRRPRRPQPRTARLVPRRTSPGAQSREKKASTWHVDTLYPEAVAGGQ